MDLTRHGLVAPDRPASGASGFMLLEVLIAFAIATLALGVMIGAAAGALRATQTAAHVTEATVRAQSRLAEAVNGGKLIPGEWEGADGGIYRWRVRVTQTAGAAPQPADSAAAAQRLYAVSVWIAWRDGGRSRDVRLDTEAIGEAIHTP